LTTSQSAFDDSKGNNEVSRDGSLVDTRFLAEFREDPHQCSEKKEERAEGQKEDRKHIEGPLMIKKEKRTNLLRSKLAKEEFVDLERAGKVINASKLVKKEGMGKYHSSGR